MAGPQWAQIVAVLVLARVIAALLGGRSATALWLSGIGVFGRLGLEVAWLVGSDASVRVRLARVLAGVRRRALVVPVVYALGAFVVFCSRGRCGIAAIGPASN